MARSMGMMRGIVVGVFTISWMIALFAASVVEPPKQYRKMKNPLKPGKELLKEASVAYDLNCSYCHGDTGKGDGPKMIVQPGRQPPNFQTADFAKRSDQWIMWRVSEGVPNTKMVAFKEQLSEKDRWSLVLLLRSFNPKSEKPKR